MLRVLQFTVVQYYFQFTHRLLQVYLHKLHLIRNLMTTLFAAAYYCLVNLLLCHFLDSQVGVLRVWNVSKSTPLVNIRVKQTGFHALSLVSSPNHKSDSAFGSGAVGVSSTSAACDTSSTNHNTFNLPSAEVLCMFLDGGVGLYDLGKRKWSFLREMVRRRKKRNLILPICITIKINTGFY